MAEKDSREYRSLSLTDKLVANTYAILEHRRRDDQTIYKRQQCCLVILGRRFLQLIDHDTQSIALALLFLWPNISLVRLLVITPLVYSGKHFEISSIPAS